MMLKFRSKSAIDIVRDARVPEIAKYFLGFPGISKYSKYSKVHRKHARIAIFGHHTFILGQKGVDPSQVLSSCQEMVDFGYPIQGGYGQIIFRGVL